MLVEKSTKLCVLTINNRALSQRFFDFSSSLGLSAAFGSDVRLRSVRKISNLYHSGIRTTQATQLNKSSEPEADSSFINVCGSKNVRILTHLLLLNTHIKPSKAQPSEKYPQDLSIATRKNVMQISNTKRVFRAFRSFYFTCFLFIMEFRRICFRNRFNIFSSWNSFHNLLS